MNRTKWNQLPEGFQDLTIDERLEWFSQHLAAEELQRAGIATEEPEQPEPQKKKKEAKSRRLQLLLKPSQVERLQNYARERGASMNEIIARAIDEYLERKAKP